MAGRWDVVAGVGVEAAAWPVEGWYVPVVQGL